MKRCSVVAMTRTQAGMNAQASPALVESEQASHMHPVNATFLLHHLENCFAASHTLYNSASPLSAAACGCAHRGILHRWHTWYVPSPCPRRVSPAASWCGTIPCFTKCHIRK